MKAPAGDNAASKSTHSDNVTTIRNYWSCMPYIAEVTAFITYNIFKGGKQKQCVKTVVKKVVENANSVWTNQNLVVLEERRKSASTGIALGVPPHSPLNLPLHPQIQKE